MRKTTASIRTETQVSAGGVVCRQNTGDSISVALISVGKPPRWQLPKGLVDSGETPETAALREVREEAGVDAVIIESLEKVEYWYQVTVSGNRVRYHKFVHFFLMRYVSGDVGDHDHEVNEARWIEMGAAIDAIAFKSERAVLAKAVERILRNGELLSVRGPE